MIWYGPAGDLRTKGFLVGATSGRTTLNGEGLQHQDGHAHILTSTVPNLISYHPAFAYEIAVIIRHGIERMYEKQEKRVFIIFPSVNENYAMPHMPEKRQGEGIISKACTVLARSAKTSDLQEAPI